ncbi:MAG TPA: hypothetical protein VHH11_00025 [Gammaproteobacteria bacterium]|jgi:hypothetical protein|nr:hypothetical protein [Gammaproteobacteria bacterium]
MDEPIEIPDREFLTWAGVQPQRWALLPSARRASWLDYLVARMEMSSDPRQRTACWKLAAAIASADRHTPAGRGSSPPPREQ